MKVQVIGCSTSWTTRPMSSYAIDDEILVDVGEGTSKEYEKLGFDSSKIKYIFITHFHCDHIFAIAHYFCRRRYLTGKDKSLTIIGGKGLKKHLNMLRYFVFAGKSAKKVRLEDFLNIVELKKEGQYQFEDFSVKNFKLEHGDVPDMAYVIEKDGKKIGFSGDCTYTENVENFVKECDICFLECCSEKTNPKHLGYDKFKQIKDKYTDKRFLGVHAKDELYQNQDKYDMEFAISGKTYEF